MSYDSVPVSSLNESSCFTGRVRTAFLMTLCFAMMIVLLEYVYNISSRIGIDFGFRASNANTFPYNSNKSRPTIEAILISYKMTPMKKISNTASYQKVTNAPQVNPHDYAYVITETSTCRKGNDKVYLLVIVCVAAARLEHREIIRDTWASLAKEHKDVRLVFMLGSVNNSSVQASIVNESSRFHDIIQENFIDHYRNLTLKSIAVLKWATLYCPQASYVMKVDDDVFVNIPRLLSVLKEKNYTRSIIGEKVSNFHPVRKNNSKWYVSKEQFNNSVYPVYAAGPSYIMSSDIVPDLYTTSLKTREVPVEDVYVTGICRSKIGANVVGHAEIRGSSSKASGCWFKSRIAGHPHSLKDIKKIWNDFQNTSLSCS